jgi:hypothetical protein
MMLCVGLLREQSEIRPSQHDDMPYAEAALS